MSRLTDQGLVPHSHSDVTGSKATQSRAEGRAGTSESGVFLVFEGLDGSGKSTLMRLVRAELEKRQKNIVQTREPGGTPLAEEIRNLLLRTDGEVPYATTELLLYAASRAQHVSHVIRPALERDQWVLCDRFTASSVAFQAYARGLSNPDVNWLNDFATQCLQPNLTILLDLTVEESRTRQGLRNPDAGDRIERESFEFHESVRRGYLEQARAHASAWMVLDARKTPDELMQILMTELERRGWLAS